MPEKTTAAPSAADDDSAVNQADMIMNAIIDLKCKTEEGLAAIEKRVAGLEAKRGDVGTAITANAKVLGELQAEVKALSLSTSEATKNLATQMGLAQKGIDEKVAVIVDQVRAIEASVEGIKEGVSALKQLRVQLDDATRTSFEKQFQRGHERMLASFQEAATTTIRDSLSRVLPPLEARVDGIARESFSEAGKQLTRKVESLGNDAGTGFVALACVAGAVAAIYTAWHFHKAMETETPDQFVIRGAEGTQVEDGTGKIIGRIGHDQRMAA